MLNPSTASETLDDPTIRRCIAFSKVWGFDGLEVRNIFAYRSTDPDVLPDIEDPVGPENDKAICQAASMCRLIVCAWGCDGDLHGRGMEVRKMLEDRGDELRCFRITKNGQPEHPLYQPGAKFATPASLLYYEVTT